MIDIAPHCPRDFVWWDILLFSASRGVGFWSSPFCTECHYFWNVVLFAAILWCCWNCLQFESISIIRCCRWCIWWIESVSGQSFCFWLWSTLCMFIIARYFPQKWHWMQFITRLYSHHVLLHCVWMCVFSLCFFPFKMNKRFLMMAYPLLITMDNVWNGDCVRTPFCYRVRRHSVSPSQCHSASKPLFTQKWQNGFLRHFYLFFCVAHFGRLQKLETTNVATSMFSPWCPLFWSMTPMHKGWAFLISWWRVWYSALCWFFVMDYLLCGWSNEAKVKLISIYFVHIRTQNMYLVFLPLFLVSLYSFD